jgi:hypothetical protein
MNIMIVPRSQSNVTILCFDGADDDVGAMGTGAGGVSKSNLRSINFNSGDAGFDMSTLCEEEKDRNMCACSSVLVRNQGPPIRSKCN